MSQKKSKHQIRQHLINTITQRWVTPKMSQDQISGIPLMVGIAIGMCILVPPHSRTKLFIALGVEAASIIWASWLYVLWKQNLPAGASKSQTRVRFNTFLYHLARVSIFFPFSLGNLAVSLLIFSSLQIEEMHVLLAVGYGLTAFTLLVNQDRLLKISVSGIQNETWKRFGSCLMILGVGAGGAGAAFGRAIVRFAPKSTSWWVMGICGSFLAMMMLGYGVLELSVVRAFVAKGAWRRG